jgi:outer membrane protein TolC
MFLLIILIGAMGLYADLTLNHATLTSMSNALEEVQALQEEGVVYGAELRDLRAANEELFELLAGKRAELARTKDTLADKRAELLALYDAPRADGVTWRDHPSAQDAPGVLATAGEFWSGAWGSIRGAGVSEAEAAE